MHSREISRSVLNVFTMGTPWTIPEQCANMIKKARIDLSDI